MTCIQHRTPTPGVEALHKGFQPINHTNLRALIPVRGHLSVSTRCQKQRAYSAPAGSETSFQTAERFSMESMRL